MLPAVEALLPESIALPDLLFLSAASLMGSLLTAALGVGGGALLITVMAGIVPPLALIPLHGVVQLGSNASRAWLSHPHLEVPKLAVFAVGAVGAALVGVGLIDSLPPEYIPLLIAVFILWLTWLPMPSISLGQTPVGLLFGGLITTLASFLVGASGPMVSAWLSSGVQTRWQYTALFSSAMTLQHLLKILVFGLVGFAFFDWLLVLVCMIAFGFIGTKIGLALLGRLPEAQFRIIFRWCLTLLAVKLLFAYL